MTLENFIYKRTYGRPKLEYETSYLKGLELIEGQFLSFSLYSDDYRNFNLRIPLNHLKIKDNKLISELNINDDDNRHLANILDSIYANEGVNLDDQIGEDDVMSNVNIEELCNYVNSISFAEILLIFHDDELLYLDMFNLEQNYVSATNDNSFKNLVKYNLDFSIPVSDVNKFYNRINCNID